MIILAHDGSIYSDWVARYALNFAVHEPDRKLLAFNVLDGKVSAGVVESRFSQLSEECKSLGVEFHPYFLSLGPSVYRSLRQAIPPDPDALMVCGTRVKPRRQKYLTGTVAEKMFRIHQCPVLALRVVQPGLFGNPHDLLLPLAGHLHGFPRIIPIFRRMSPALRSVHLFRTMLVNPFRHPHLTPAMEDLLKHKGLTYLRKIRAEMNEELGPLSFRCDLRVTISSDWVDEVLIQANRQKTQLMLLGVTERSLAFRVFHSDSVEKILHETPCDVGIYCGL